MMVTAVTSCGPAMSVLHHQVGARCAGDVDLQGEEVGWQRRAVGGRAAELLMWRLQDDRWLIGAWRRGIVGTPLGCVMPSGRGSAGLDIGLAGGIGARDTHVQWRRPVFRSLGGTRSLVSWPGTGT